MSAGARPPPTRWGRWWRAADTAGGGLVADLILYAVSAAFAALTAATSTLLPHRAWGSIAAIGYALAAGAVVVQLVIRRRAASSAFVGTRTRAIVAALTWASTALLPLVIQSAQRASGRTDRAQEEVVVVERAGERLVEHGSPYLAEDRIAVLPPAEWLLGYLPYQPGMALFGLPRALAGAAWWTDARVWFAVATAAALGVALACLPRGPGLVRAAQAATVLPVCALTLATGGDDLPVLALCLLALALAGRGRLGAAGVAAGLAGALKLFAWPVTLVLLVHAATRGRRAFARFAAGAVGLPLLALVPPVLVDAGAVVDNVLRFPLGEGLVSSPAQSPFPGYLIASTLPGGRAVAAGLLVAAGVAIAVGLVRHPPRTASAVALICAYGLLAAILLMPSTRFGYVLYPAAFAVWAFALPAGEPADSGDGVPLAPRAAYT
ncbi:MAG TPA: glycosyltransferase 87 family protein [Pilimelia sp.]|nr:glycosyltransferase 87 family protein [Pilimelia sp.]